MTSACVGSTYHIDFVINKGKDRIKSAMASKSKGMDAQAARDALLKEVGVDVACVGEGVELRGLWWPRLLGRCVRLRQNCMGITRHKL